jgi:two-component system sensor histidine kinase VicK
MADPSQIEQVLVNLITNAIKYSTEGDVTLDLQRIVGNLPDDAETTANGGAREWAVVSVKDNGIGIPPNQVRQVFDQFFRGDAPAVRRVAGTGLGLYICKSIVDAHHGRIWVESHLGRGTTFFVALPQE